MHSGRTNCAGGYFELIARRQEWGTQRLLALVSHRCMSQVTVGAAIARRLCGPHVPDVGTVAMPDAGTVVAAQVLRVDRG